LYYADIDIEIESGWTHATNDTVQPYAFRISDSFALLAITGANFQSRTSQLETVLNMILEWND
jgi:hypothetical protein